MRDARSEMQIDPAQVVAAVPPVVLIDEMGCGLCRILPARRGDHVVDDDDMLHSPLVCPLVSSDG